MAERELLLGDEAVALGAIHAGISGAYGYPGTPSTELFEFVQGCAEAEGIHAVWSANEKVAYEEALGMSFAGKRSIISMKHVGLNVAADAFVNSGVTGIHGGLVLCVADDPGMHSSQNEQDSRYYAKFALVPCLEPADQQEAYDMARVAFDLSEQTKLPVVMRIVTRLAHSRADVVTGDRSPQNAMNPLADTFNFTLLPTIARVLYQRLTDKQPDLEARSERSPWNVLLDGPDHSRGVIVNGIAWNYLGEAYEGRIPYPVLKVGQYPAPVAKIRALLEMVDELVILEEGYPFLEEMIRGVTGVHGKRIRGKLDGAVPRCGELTPMIVAKAMGLPVPDGMAPTLEVVPNRPPTLCPGCGHIDAFAIIKAALAPWGDVRMFGDIGCYTLGYYPPHNAIGSCVDMGASISMASGAAHAGMHPVVAAIGDSTFGHSGMTGLMTAIRENTPMTLVILDNGTVAMTGTQKTMCTGEDLVNIVKGLGVDPDHFKIIEPHRAKAAEQAAILRAEFEYRGTSVVIARRPCVQMKRKGG
jgi:indolepyruvate ferredoxin oxidoreductase alpha subunit